MICRACLCLCICSPNNMEKNVVYCLLCNEPQLSISTHLSRVCLKDGTAQEREQEASRATASQELFSREGRLWSFSELQEFCKDTTSCIKLCSRLQSRGFIITDAPQTWPTVLPTQRSDELIATLAHTYCMTHTHFQHRLTAVTFATGLIRRKSSPWPKRTSSISTKSLQAVIASPTLP